MCKCNHKCFCKPTIRLPLEVNKTYLDGYNRKVRIICTDRVAPVGSAKVIGLCIDSVSENPGFYTDEGLMFGTGYDKKLNLVSEYREPDYRWFNVYDTFISQWLDQNKNSLYSSRTQADSKAGDSKRLAVCRINLETGEVTNEDL